MTQTQIIALLILICSGLAALLICALLDFRNERKKGTSKESEPANVQVVEIPYNDKNWHVRYGDVERIRAKIVQLLQTYPACIVTLDKCDEEASLNHGEVCALLLPFLKKGYFAYKEITGYGGYKVTRFRVMKHKDAEPNALEITEELLTKNAQL